jgi:uncharacterized membrane protein YhaH (DUF805 family)
LAFFFGIGGFRTVHWFIHGLRQYANFHGRASRREFWSFCLVSFALDTLSLCLVPLLPLIGVPLMWGLLLLTATPTFAVSTRRLHDTGRTGWLLAKSGALTAAQAAFWFGVGLSHGQDVLAWAAALTAGGLQFILSVVLLYFYCQPGEACANQFGESAPQQPL